MWPMKGIEAECRGGSDSLLLSLLALGPQFEMIRLTNQTPRRAPAKSSNAIDRLDELLYRENSKETLRVCINCDETTNPLLG